VAIAFSGFSLVPQGVGRGWCDQKAAVRFVWFV